MEDKNSMLYWYPKIKDVAIPQPTTEILEIGIDMAMWGFPEDNLWQWEKKIKEYAHRIGYPLFMRTDQTSDKHSWNKSCFVESEEVLMDHILRLLEFNYCATPMGLPCVALVFREYIPMDSNFVAFHGDLPISPERRYFIRDGKIQCHHPYWVEDAIGKWLESKGLVRKYTPKILKDNLPDNWKEILAKMNTETRKEVELLSYYAINVAVRLKGYWSVDFCKAKDGMWYLIDCAKGENSYHPECEFK